MITRELKLDIVPNGIPKEIRLNQYDDDFTINIHIFASDGVVTIEDGTTATINGTKKDGNYYSASATLSGNTVVVSGDKQMTAAAGKNYFEVQLLKDGKNLYTANFVIDVEKSAMPLDEEISESVIRQMEDMESATALAKSTLSDLQTAVLNAQSATTAAKNAAAEAKGTVDLSLFIDSDGYISITHAGRE